MVDQVDALIARGVDVNALARGRTALVEASRYGEVECVKVGRDVLVTVEGFTSISGCWRPRQTSIAGKGGSGQPLCMLPLLEVEAEASNA